MNAKMPENRELFANPSSEELTDSQRTSMAIRASDNDPLIGLLVAERYEILSEVGLGGWSVVYDAIDKSLNRHVAIKILHNHLCVDQAKLQRFQREADSASKLNHPNIAVIYDFGLLKAGRPYIIMEFIEGLSLSELIREKKCLSAPECLTIFDQICDGVDAIHKLGLIHRDLKPGNIKISNSGFVKVLDFGLAKWILQEDDQLTKTDESIGTPAYMSPEQCLGKPLDARSDIYSIGCMMYEAISGAKAFAADNSLICMQNHVQSNPPSLGTVRPDLKVPIKLELIILKALAKKPADRFASVAELKSALALPMYSRSPVARLLLQLQLKWLATRKRRQAAMVPALVFAFLVLCAVVVWQNSRAPLKQSMLNQMVLNGATARTIEFPDRPVGKILLPDGLSKKGFLKFKVFAIAKGRVPVPKFVDVNLVEIPSEEVVSMQLLSKVQPNDLAGVDVSFSRLSDNGLAAINKMKGLKSLRIDNTFITNAGLLRLDLPKLILLAASNTKMTDESLSQIAKNSPGLQSLFLSNTQVSDASAASISKLKDLRALGLQQTKITDRSLFQFAALHQLTRLRLGGDHITDTGIKQLPRSLQLLDLHETKISDNAIQALSKLENLRDLNVSNTLVSPAGVARLGKLIPKCRVTATQVTQAPPVVTSGKQP